MKKLFITLLIIILSPVAIAVAGDKKLEVDFTYSDSFEKIYFYLNNNRICEIDEWENLPNNEYRFSCISDKIPYGKNQFHMTVVNSIESGESNIFPFTVDLKPVENFIL